MALTLFQIIVVLNCLISSLFTITIAIPDCNNQGGNIPDDSGVCERYYECEWKCTVLWLWGCDYEPQERHCPEGQGFELTANRCISGLVNCQTTSVITTPTTTTTTPITTTTTSIPTTSTTTSTTTTSTTTITTPTTTTSTTTSTTPTASTPTTTTSATTATTIASGGAPICYGPSRHPAALCYEYYECVQSLFVWIPQLKTCPDGKAFDKKRLRCVAAASVKCSLPIRPPECHGPGKYLAASNSQYYECVATWIPRLKNCPKGKIFNARTGHCVCHHV